MKKILLFLASSLMLFASCAKEDSKVEPTPVDPTKPEGELIYSVTVALGDSTKATLGEPEGTSGKMFRKVTWNTGDQICVNGSVSDELDAEYDGKETAMFTFSNPISGSAPYIACYPASVYKDATHVTLPASQGNTEGANKAFAFPMAGIATSSEGLHTIQLKQLCGFIRVKVQGNLTLSSMSFTGNNNEQVSGEFTLDWTDGVPTLTAKETPTDADKTVSVSSSAELAVGTDKYCVIAVPANTYSKGAKLSFSTSGNTFDVNSPSSKSITRASVKNISTLSVVKIASADDWNTFATNFNNDKYPNEGSSTFVNFTSDLDFSGKGIVVMNRDKDFAGTISGNSHSFKNVKLANEAIVGTLAPAGVIKGVKIDSGSKMTMTSESGTITYFAPLVGDLQGSIENCESAADMDFLVSSSRDFFIGGLVGRTRGGSIKNCKVSGTLKDVETTDIGKDAYAYVGGITSDVNQNPAETQDGSMSGCEFSGKILMGPDAGTDGTGVTGITCKNTTGFRIGGIVGRAQNGTVTNCSTASAAVVDVRGDLLVIYVGGVVGNGQDTITGCTNAAAVSIWSANTDASGGYARVGGVAGSSSATLSGCSNSAKVYMRAQHRNSYYGGVIGFNSGTVSACNNSGEILEDTYRPRYLYIGGVLGGNTAYGNVTNVQNTGNVTVETVPVNSTMGTTGCGGVIGYNLADIVGNNKIYNTGTVTVNIIKTTYLNVSAGGIIGINKTSLSGVTNKGKVQSTCNVAVTTSSFTAFGGIIGSQQNGATAATVSNCVNDRDAVPATTDFIYAYITSKDASTCLNWCEGGIIGYVYDSNVTIKECTNNASVRHQANAAATGGRTSFTGGIIGRITTVTYAASVSDCTNYGRCYTNNYNNNTALATGPFIGGVIGSAEGLSGKTVSISGCSNKDEDGATAYDVCNYAYRGTIGGIVGYASYVSLSNSNSSKILSNNANSTYCGGLVGQAINTTISGGTVSSPYMEKCANIGGVVGLLDSGSSVSGTKYASEIKTAGTKYGAVAAVSVTGTTITNAKIASTAKVMGNAASTADSYVCGDSNATITGTTIE